MQILILLLFKILSPRFLFSLFSNVLFILRLWFDSTNLCSMIVFPTAIKDYHCFAVWCWSTQNQFYLWLSWPKDLLDLFFVKHNHLSVVWASMTCVVEIQEDLIKEISVKSSSDEVRLLFFSINISLQKQLLMLIEWHHNPPIIFIPYHDNML